MEITFEDYKKKIEEFIVDYYDNIDLGKVEMMMNVVMHKIRRHYHNERTIKQAIGYLGLKKWN